MKQIRTALTTIAVPLAIVIAAGSIGWWTAKSAPDQRAPLAVALDSIPSDALVTGFTDWAGIRERLDVDGVTTAERERLTNVSAIRDLSTRSVLGRSIDEMDVVFGWSAADVSWEVFAQAVDGAAVVARLDTVSAGTVEDGLERLGYQETGAVWVAPESSVAVRPDLIGTLTAVAVVPAKHLVVASNDAAYVRTILSVVDGSRSSLLDVRAAADIAEGLSGTMTALIETGRYACDTASLSSLDQSVLDQAEAAVNRAGRLENVEFGGRGLSDVAENRQLAHFAMSFESPATAAQQGEVRAQLAQGPFIGRSGQVEDSLQLRSTRLSGSAVTFAFDHDPDTVAYMVGKAPLLFASCPAG